MQTHAKQLTPTAKRTVGAHRLRNPAWLLLLGAVCLFLLWAGLKTWRLVRVAQSLQAHQATAESLMANGWMQADPDDAEALILNLRQDVLLLKGEARLFLPLAPHLKWLPKVGPVVAAAPQLLEIADAGTEAAGYAMRGLKPGLALLQNDSPDSRLAALVHVLDAAEPDLIQAGLSLERVAVARAGLGDGSSLPWRVRAGLELADMWLPLAQDGLKVAQILPEIMGSSGLRRYLIIAQNEDELRPTGGFISGAGLIAVEGGRIIDLRFEDANYVDDWANKPYDFPPQPLYDFMLLELFAFRDANFWPDFPTSAEAAMRLYSYGQDVPPLDGAVAIDQRFLQLLIEATGPVPIAEEDLVIDRHNVIDSLRAAWAIQEEQDVSTWLRDRKAFLATFASAIRYRLEFEFTAVDPLLLVRNLHEAAQAKHLQLYMRDPAVAAVLDEQNWDGRVQNRMGQDVLMVVDTNVGYNKANILVNRSLDYHVTLAEDGNAQASLTVHYAHTGPTSDSVCLQGTLAKYAEPADYVSLADECYWNYMRVYVPQGSQLLHSSSHTVPGETLFSGHTWQATATTIEDVVGLSGFANFLLLPRGEILSSSYQYRLPDSVVQSGDDQKTYRLLVYKQAGTDAQPMSVKVTLPDQAQFISADPAPTRIEGAMVVFDLVQDADIVISLAYDE